MAGEIGYYEDRIKKLEAVIAKLLKLMPDLGKPDWYCDTDINNFLCLRMEEKNTSQVWTIFAL